MLVDSILYPDADMFGVLIECFKNAISHSLSYG